MHPFSFLFLALVACSAAPGDAAGDTANEDGTPQDTSSADTAADTGADGDFDDDALAAELWTEIDGYSGWSHPVGRTDTPASSEAHMSA